MPNGTETGYNASRLSYTVKSELWCNTIQLETLRLDAIGPWSVYAVGVLTYATESEEVTSNTLNINVVEPIFGNKNAEKLNHEKIAEIAGINNLTYPYNAPSFNLMDWSPDGKFILFKYVDFKNYDRNKGLIPVERLGIMSPDAKDVKILNIGEDFLSFFQARISPFSDSILFIATKSIEDIPQAFKYDLSKEELMPIAPTITNDTTNTYVDEIDWMPDGNMVYLERIQSRTTDEYLELNLWLADSNGKKLKVLYKGVDFTFFDTSPDGQKIAFLGYEKTEQSFVPAITIFNLNSNESSSIMVHESPNIIRWAPNSELVLFHVGRLYHGGAVQVATVDGTLREELVGGSDDPTTFTISPDGRFVLYGIDYRSTTGKASDLFEMELLKPMPEFSVSVILIMITGMAAVIFIAAMRQRFQNQVSNQL